MADKLLKRHYQCLRTLLKKEESRHKECLKSINECIKHERKRKNFLGGLVAVIASLILEFEAIRNEYNESNTSLPKLEDNNLFKAMKEHMKLDELEKERLDPMFLKAGCNEGTFFCRGWPGKGASPEDWRQLLKILTPEDHHEMIDTIYEDDLWRILGNSSVRKSYNSKLNAHFKQELPGGFPDLTHHIKSTLSAWTCVEVRSNYWTLTERGEVLCSSDKDVKKTTRFFHNRETSLKVLPPEIRDQFVAEMKDSQSKESSWESPGGGTNDDDRMEPAESSDELVSDGKTHPSMSPGERSMNPSLTGEITIGESDGDEQSIGIDEMDESMDIDGKTAGPSPSSKPRKDSKYASVTSETAICESGGDEDDETPGESSTYLDVTGRTVIENERVGRRIVDGALQKIQSHHLFITSDQYKAMVEGWATLVVGEVAQCLEIPKHTPSTLEAFMKDMELFRKEDDKRRRLAEIRSWIIDFITTITWVIREIQDPNPTIDNMMIEGRGWDKNSAQVKAQSHKKAARIILTILVNIWHSTTRQMSNYKLLVFSETMSWDVLGEIATMEIESERFVQQHVNEPNEFEINEEAFEDLSVLQMVGERIGSLVDAPLHGLLLENYNHLQDTLVSILKLASRNSDSEIPYPLLPVSGNEIKKPTKAHTRLPKTLKHAKSPKASGPDEAKSSLRRSTRKDGKAQ